MIYDNRGKRIINKVQQLLVEEFKIPVLFDRQYRPRNTSYFNIDYNDISDVSFLAGGMIRQYNLTIKYFLLLEGFQRHTHQNYLSKQYLKQLVQEGAPLSQDRKNEQKREVIVTAGKIRIQVDKGNLNNGR